MERCNRRPPYLSQAADTHSVCTPAKVCKPLVATRVKQRHSCPCLWIDRGGFVAFESVTNWTSKPEIVFLIGPTLRNWNDMFNFEPCHYEMLWTETIATTIACRLSNALFDFDRDVSAPHRGSVEGWDQTTRDSDFDSLRFANKSTAIRNHQLFHARLLLYGHLPLAVD